MQPGDTIKPGGQQPQPEMPPSDETPNQPAAPQPAQPSEPETPWATDVNQPQAVPNKSQANVSVTWTASEYIAHEKSAGWYVILAVAATAGAAVIYLLTQDKVTVGMILVVALVFGIFASRQPEVLSYAITNDGIAIGNKQYPFAAFRSFAVQEEGAISSILLIPLQRFMPGISIYFPPEQGQQIVDALGKYLPHEERPLDAIDRLMRRVRF